MNFIIKEVVDNITKMTITMNNNDAITTTVVIVTEEEGVMAEQEKDKEQLLEDKFLV